MYTKEHIRQALYTVLRGAGELWFPAHGEQEDIDLPVDEVWAKIEAALSRPQEVVSKLDEVRAAVQTWLATQGYDRCHYYPEIFQRICDMLGIVQATAPRLPPLEEFQEGCRRFQAEQYGVERLVKDIATPRRPRVLAVGIRRFQRDAPATTSSTWTWEMMLRCPAMTATRTPQAWSRLSSIGLEVDTAVDLLPPGGDVDEAQATSQARYLQGVLAGLEAADKGYDCVVLLGGKTSKAFRTADTRLADLRLLELRHGFITLPTPHVVEQDGDGWWSSEAKQARLRSIVGKLMSWRCVECVNSDTEVGGCVECGTHAADCQHGSFCVQCCKRAS